MDRPHTKQYVSEGTPGATKVSTKQQVTDRACRRYQARLADWRQVPNWSAVLLDEAELTRKEERVPDAPYKQPRSESPFVTESDFSDEESVRTPLSSEGELTPRTSKY